MLPAPQPGHPGPFSLGDPDVLEKKLIDAGFKNVEIARIDAPVRLDSAFECLQFEQKSFGAFESDGRFHGPWQMLVASGTR